jgi:hypothetical protein
MVGIAYPDPYIGASQTDACANRDEAHLVRNTPPGATPQQKNYIDISIFNPARLLCRSWVPAGR